jgi:hypothetical protein
MSKSLAERFAAKWEPEPNTGCWLWLGGGTERGYGNFWSGERMEMAHRMSWMLARGPIPVGMFLDHMCRTPGCVNPAHLRVVTPRENSVFNSVSIPATNLAKTHCSNGHPYSGRNVLLMVGKGSPFPHRACRTCARDRYRAKARRKHARPAVLITTPISGKTGAWFAPGKVNGAKAHWPWCAVVNGEILLTKHGIGRRFSSAASAYEAVLLAARTPDPAREDDNAD